MRWQVVIEAETPAAAKFVEEWGDHLMERLVDAGFEDPTVGASLATGTVEIEFVVRAESMPEAQQIARDAVFNIWHPPDEGAQFIGQSTRRALVPA